MNQQVKALRKLMVGRKLRLPVDIMFGRPDDQTKSDSTYADYVADLEEGLAHAHDFVHAHLNLSADRIK